MRFTIALPRDAIAISMVRRVIGDALRTIGVAESCIADIVLAVSEACTNVVRYGGPARSYEVRASVGDGKCVLKIADRGRGLPMVPGPVVPGPVVPGPAPSPETPAETEEGGRGIQIMQAVVDDVEFDSAPGRGTIVSLEKRLDWQAAARSE